MTANLNWVDRRALREDNLTQHAVDVWELVRTAIGNCCTSFRTRFPNMAEEVKNKTENGHRILVEITFKTPTGRRCRHVSIEFSKTENLITTTTDGEAAKRFPISADESHTFLKNGQSEISADELTKIALEDAFFKPPSPPDQFTPPRIVGTFS